jgi:glycosyltransferase involved in cell wall biosynthesis
MRTNTQKNNRDKPVTAIIPAFNEAHHIGTLLDVLLWVGEISEIIVVNDCSTDNTAEIVRTYCQRDGRIHLVSLPLNLGKGGALAAGAQASKTDLVVFLDADLISVQPVHILGLIEPVRNGMCGMTLGLFKGGRLQTDISHRLTPFLSGQRCLKWSLFKHTPEMETSRWGAEVALSLFARQNKLKVQTVPWLGVTHVMRPEKTSWLDGIWSHSQMWLDIGKYILRHPATNKEPSMQKFRNFVSSLREYEVNN